MSTCDMRSIQDYASHHTSTATVTIIAARELSNATCTLSHNAATPATRSVHSVLVHDDCTQTSDSDTTTTLTDMLVGHAEEMCCLLRRGLMRLASLKACQCCGHVHACIATGAPTHAPLAPYRACLPPSHATQHSRVHLQVVQRGHGAPQHGKCPAQAVGAQPPAGGRGTHIRRRGARPAQHGPC
jgi:hypothetical protein